MKLNRTLFSLLLSALMLLPALAMAQKSQRASLPRKVAVRTTSLATPASASRFVAPFGSVVQQSQRFAPGDAPVLYGNVIYSEANLSKGVYSFPAQANTTLTRVYGDYNFNINGPAVRWNGNYSWSRVKTMAKASKR